MAIAMKKFNIWKGRVFGTLHTRLHVMNETLDRLDKANNDTASEEPPIIMAEVQTTIIPHSQQPYVSRTYPSRQELDQTIKNARQAFEAWRHVPLQERIAIGYKFIVISSMHAKYCCKCLICMCRTNSRRWLTIYLWN